MTTAHIPVQPLALAALLLVLGACENHTRNSSGLPQPLDAPVVRSPAKSAADRRADDLSQYATDVQAAIDAGTERAPATDATAPPAPRSVTERPTRSRPAASGAPAPVPGDVGANTPASVPEARGTFLMPIVAPGAAPKPERTPEERRSDAVADLASMLKPGVRAGSEPLRVAMPLIALDAISPGAGSAHLEDMLSAITPDKRRSVEALQDVVRAAMTDPNLGSGDPASLSRVLREKADSLTPTQSADGFSLGNVALCQRVEGFGRYTPLSATIVAGRPAAMILYTEVRNFSQMPSAPAPQTGGSESEGWAVELAQSVRLYLDSDGSEQVVFPEAVAKDASRSRRRDFYLVQRIDLPRTLSVGNYNLKVKVRDVHSKAEDERAIAIRVVADPSAAGLGQAGHQPAPVRAFQR